MTTDLALPTEGQQALVKASTIGEIRRIIGQAKSIEEEARLIRKRLAQVDGRPEDVEWLRSVGAQWASIRIEAAAKGVDIIEQGRERGEVLNQGRPEKTPHNRGFSLADLSLTSQELARWRAVHDIDYVSRQRYYDWAPEQDGKDGEITMAGLIRFVRQPDEVGEPLPLPEGAYRCIVIDPPWPMQKIEREQGSYIRQGVDLDYPVMSLEDISTLALPAAEDGCHVYCWTTQRFLRDTFDVMGSWGVKTECTLVWHKNVGFTPYSFMYDAEFVLFGRIGHLPLLKNGERVVFEGKVQGHSQKPEEFYELVRTVSPEPRIDLFGRRQIEGFDSWGNEAPE